MGRTDHPCGRRTRASGLRHQQDGKNDAVFKVTSDTRAGDRRVAHARDYYPIWAAQPRISVAVCRANDVYLGRYDIVESRRGKPRLKSPDNRFRYYRIFVGFDMAKYRFADQHLDYPQPKSDVSPERSSN